MTLTVPRAHWAFTIATLQSLPGITVLGFDTAMRFTIATGDALRRHGYDPDVMLGRSLADTVPADAYPGLRDRYAQILEGGTVSWVQRSLGQGPDYLVDGTPVRGTDGGMLGGVLVVRDVPTAERLEAERLRAVIALQNDVAASGLDVDAVMDLVAHRAAALTGADAGVIELPDGDEMVYRAAAGTAAEHVGLRLRIDSSLSGLALTSGAVVRCEDATADPRVNAEACRKVGALSMLCVPLRYGDATIGVLKVYSARVDAFADDDLEMLAHLSGVIASQMRHGRPGRCASRGVRRLPTKMQKVHLAKVTL